jgi:hypothetical protein
MSSQAGAALLTKIALTLSNPGAGQITQFLTLAEGWDMREVAFDLPSTVTDIADRDSLNLRGPFARRVNTIPLPGDVWSGSGTYLWNIYGDLLNGGVILADILGSDTDEARVQAARAIIGPPDTPQYQAYVTYRDRCGALEHSWIKFTLSGSEVDALAASARRCSTRQR